MIAAAALVALLLAFLVGQWWVRRRLPPLSKVGTTCAARPGRLALVLAHGQCSNCGLRCHSTMCAVCAGHGGVLPSVRRWWWRRRARALVRLQSWLIAWHGAMASTCQLQKRFTWRCRFGCCSASTTSCPAPLIADLTVAGRRSRRSKTHGQTSGCAAAVRAFQQRPRMPSYAACRHVPASALGTRTQAAGLPNRGLSD